MKREFCNSDGEFGGVNISDKSVDVSAHFFSGEIRNDKMNNRTLRGLIEENFHKDF